MEYWKWGNPPVQFHLPIHYFGKYRLSIPLKFLKGNCLITYLFLNKKLTRVKMRDLPHSDCDFLCVCNHPGPYNELYSKETFHVTANCQAVSPYRALVQTRWTSTNSSTYSETESCSSFLGNKEGWIAMSVHNHAAIDLQQNASGFRCPHIFWEYKSNNTLHLATQYVCKSFLELCEYFQVWLVLWFTK